MILSSVSSQTPTSCTSEIYLKSSFSDKQIDLSTVDLKKLKVRDLKKILNDWDENCEGCLEKPDFIKRIEELKPKYASASNDKKEL